MIAAASISGNESDLLALLDFKNQISDDPNGILKSWNASKHCCQTFVSEARRKPLVTKVPFNQIS